MFFSALTREFYNKSKRAPYSHEGDFFHHLLRCQRFRQKQALQHFPEGAGMSVNTLRLNHSLVRFINNLKNMCRNLLNNMLYNYKYEFRRIEYMPYLYAWFLMVAVMMTMFLVTGATRLGFGMWYLFLPKDERPYLMQAIHPHIDGSSLWIVLTASALFFLFPQIFRTLFTGFYPIISVVAIVLVLRTIGLLLRRKYDVWHFGSLWDVLIALGNFIPLFLLGMIAGYILKGIPLYTEGRFNVNVIGYISHYTIVSGLILACAGAILSFSAIGWNSDGRIRSHARKWAFYSSLLIIVLIFDLSLWSLLLSPYISESVRANPLLFVIPATAFVAACVFPVLIVKRRFRLAYFTAVIVMLGLSITFFVSIYPHLQVIFERVHAPRQLMLSGNRGDRLQAVIEQRKTLIPIYMIMMVATAFLQARMFYLHHRFAHCPLPHDIRDEELL